MKEYRYFVYIMTNKNDNVLYIGVTNNLIRRIYEHRGKLTSGFTEKYNCTKLIYFEETNNIQIALDREKQLKKWRREKKNFLVNKMNPEWKDLSDIL